MADAKIKPEGFYKNKQGNMSYAQMWELKKMSEEDREKFLADFKICKDPCPPNKLRPKWIMCFYCKDCYLDAIENVKLKDVKKEAESEGIKNEN